MKQSYIFGVVGHHIGYSRSPEIFKSISELKGFRHSFVLHDIGPAEFDTTFPNVLKTGIDGFSVTIPHKKRVIPYLDEVDDNAQLIGAVNSVGVRGGRVLGFNTDSHGFAVPLAKHRDMLKDGTALIFGAGGAASAVVHSLSTGFAVSRFYVIGRDMTKLENFRSSLGEGLPGVEILPVSIGEQADKLGGVDYSLIVNCTPLGGWNHPDESPIASDFQWLPGRLYYDLSYNSDNKMVVLAANNNLIAFDGTAMLVGQAIRSFELWTGMSVEFEPVYRAVFGSV